MASMPLFSLITVTRNNLPGLQKTARSVQSQACSDTEWIIIDGASTDGTTDLLKALPANITSEPDTGIYNAMNKGIERASGDYLLFLNAGDQLAAPQTLQNIAQSIEGTPDFIYGDALEDCGGALRPKPARSHHTLALGMFTHHQAMLYRRTALGDIRYNEDYTIAADYDLTARLLLKDTRALYLPFPICIFETGGLSQQKAQAGRKEQLDIRKTLRLANPLTNTLLYLVQSCVWSLRQRLPGLYWLFKSRS